MTNKGEEKLMFNVIKEAVTEVFKEMGVITRKDLEYLPSKEEYYKREDKMMKELKKIDENITTLISQVSDHSDKIEKLEKMHSNGHHLATI